MNRREALKKLAISGAIAAGGSMVVSSTAVAQTHSGELIVGVPLAGVPVPITQPPSQNGTFRLAIQAPAACTDGGTVTATYAWRVNGYTLTPPRNSSFNVVDVASGQTIITINNGGSYSNPDGPYTAGGSDVQLKRGHSILKSGDTYDIGVLAEWSCSHTTISAEYRMQCTIPGPVTTTVLYDSRMP